ncbi:MAG: hypothetical protein GQ570_03770 [Helicobacteraceae bacterium]|nr:hypothetical protein [Helicobacteraceae bacterium]
MKTRYPCPKCGGIAVLVIEDREVIHQCLCGIRKVVEEVKDGMVIYRSDKPSTSTLPMAGTKLSKCLGMLYANEPATTQTIAEKTKQTSSNTASQLTVLQAKGFALRTHVNKGVAGGSTWEVTPLARRIINGERI